MRTTVLSVALVALFGWSGSAEDRPNFTGTWVMDIKRSESAAQGANAVTRMPVRLEISRDHHAVIIKTLHDDHAQSVAYIFGEPQPGTSNNVLGENNVLGDQPERKIIRAVARWDGAVLVTETVYTVSGFTTTHTAKYQIRSGGREIVVENELKVEHGYEAQRRVLNGGSVGSDVYVKQ